MYKVTWLLLFTLITLSTTAQGVFSNKTNAALKMVIEDYPNHFSNIKGDRISSAELASDYKSKVVIPGSVNCTLTQYNKDAAYNWKCELFTSADFEKAKSKFSDLYNEIHNTIIKVEGEKPVILNGQYELPEKDKHQTNIFFHFLPATGIIKKLNVQLEMILDNGIWKITLQVYDEKDRELPVGMKSEA
jgi:hypothetical protein